MKYRSHTRRVTRFSGENRRLCVTPVPHAEGDPGERLDGQVELEGQVLQRRAGEHHLMGALDPDFHRSVGVIAWHAVEGA